MLGHRQRDSGDIHFLKCVRAEDLAGNVAGNADDRNRVQHCCCDAGDEIRRAGAASGNAHTNLAGSARVAVGHVRGALLVAHQYMMNGKLAQRVVCGQNGSARISEDVRYALTDERGPKNLRACEACGCGEVSVRVRGL